MTASNPVAVGDVLDFEWYGCTLGEVRVVALTREGVVLDRAVRTPLMRLLGRPARFVVPYSAVVGQ